MCLGSNKQASGFTVPGCLLVAINSMRVTVLNKMAPSPEQKPQMVHFWMHSGFFSNAYNARRKYPFQNVILRNLTEYLKLFFLIRLYDPQGLSLAFSLWILSTASIG